MPKRPGLALAALLLAACEPPLDPGVPVLSVATEHAAYALDPGTGSVQVGFSITNRGEGAVYVSRCGDRVMAALDRWAAGGWEQYSGDGCLAVHPTAPAALAPGGTLRAVRTVGERGRYQLRIAATGETSEPGGWTESSNPFTIE